MMSPELRMPGGVGGRRGQSRLLPDARVQANLHQYLSTHVIPAQAGIQEHRLDLLRLTPRHSRAGGNPGGREEEFLDSRLRGNDVLEQGKIQEFRGTSYLSPTPPFKKRSLW